jgi:hypothetical protein
VSKHENEALNQRQNATSELSAAMRLDRETERELYVLYRNYFRLAETGGRDALWRELEAGAPGPEPSRELADTILSAYRQDLFLPDFLSTALVRLRASRGRAWFWTRWSYEESRHLLGLHEWLIARNVASASELDALSEGLLGRQRWMPASDDAVYLFADALLWELSEIERGEELLTLAGGDEPLVKLLTATLADERAQCAFFRDALNLIRSRHPERVAEALRTLASEQESDRLAEELANYLDAPLPTR